MIIVVLAMLVLAKLILYGFLKAITIDDYISDECWYVTSSTNILRRVFHAHVCSCFENYCYYTIILHQNCTVNAMKTKLVEVLSAKAVIVKEYSKLNGIAVKIVQNTPLDYMLAYFKGCIADVYPGILPDSENVNNYFNFEHPPLAKYIIGLSILLLGNQPLAWRLPSLLAGITTAVFAILLAYKIIVNATKEFRDIVRGLAVCAAALIFDPALTSMSSVAMIDIYVALFTIIAIYLLVRQRYLVSAVFVGLAGTAKLSGFFALIPVLALHLIGVLPAYVFASYMVVSLAVYLILNLPLIAYLGLNEWINQLLSALAWHTTSRPSGPPFTDPLGLVLGLKPFVLHYVNGHPLLVAYSNIFEGGASLTIALFIVILYVIGRRLKAQFDELLNLFICSLAWLGIVFGYVLTYIAGNHTLYSFYAVHFTPIAAAILGGFIGVLPIFVEKVRNIYSILRGIVRDTVFPLKSVKALTLYTLTLSWLLVVFIPPKACAYSTELGFIGVAACSAFSSKPIFTVFLLALASFALFCRLAKKLSISQVVFASLLYSLAVITGHGSGYDALAPAFFLGSFTTVDYLLLGLLAPSPLVLPYIVYASNVNRVQKIDILAFIVASLLSTIITQTLLGSSNSLWSLLASISKAVIAIMLVSILRYNRTLALLAGTAIYTALDATFAPSFTAFAAVFSGNLLLAIFALIGFLEAGLHVYGGVHDIRLLQILAIMLGGILIGTSFTTRRARIQS